MANSSTVTIQVVATGAAILAGVPLTQFNNASSPAEVLQIVLASGTNSVAIPAGTTFITVQLPSSNAAATTLKGVSGDTGIPLLAAGGFAGFQPASTDTTFVLNSASLQTAPTTIGFW